jgi:hypothetical protein
MQSSSLIQVQAKPTILTYQAYQAKPTTPKTPTSQAHGHGWLGGLVAISTTLGVDVGFLLKQQLHHLLVSRGILRMNHVYSSSITVENLYEAAPIKQQTCGNKDRMETWGNQQSAVQTGSEPHRRRGLTG